MTLGCVVLASGESVRFGSNKLLADFAGEPMLRRLFAVLPEGLKSIVVTRSLAVRDLAQAYGLPCILHHLPEVRDTIRLGLSALADTDGCLFCVGDQPLLTRRTLEAVLATYRERPEGIVRAAYRSREGNPALFAPPLYGELLSLGEGEAGVTVIRRHADQVSTVEAAFAEELTDVDTPETLRALEAFQRTMKKE